MFEQMKVEYCTYRSYFIFRFKSKEWERGAVYDLNKECVSVEILDGGEFLSLKEEDEDVAVELQSEVEQSEW